MSKSRFALEQGELSEVAKKIAHDELRESDEQVATALENLRLLMRETKKVEKNDQKVLYFPEDEEFLKIFLRPCKYYHESALELMKRVADFKVKHDATIGASLTPVSEKSAMVDHRVVNVLTDRDQNGRRVLIAHIGGAWDTKEISGDQIFRLFYMIHLAAMLEPETQVRGVVVILDFENLSMKQIRQLTPSFSIRLLSFIQEAMPLRLKEVHIVKQPFIFNMVWNVFKPFIQEKLKKRLFFHGKNMTELVNHLGKDHMPSNYGGNLPEIDYSSADWYPTIEELSDKVEKWHTYGWKDE